MTETSSNEQDSPVVCPKCGSTEIEQRNHEQQMIQKASGVLLTSAGAAAGTVGGAASGASVGAAIGTVAGPLGVIVGGTIGTFVGAISVGITGGFWAIVLVKAGVVIDKIFFKITAAKSAARALTAFYNAYPFPAWYEISQVRELYRPYAAINNRTIPQIASILVLHIESDRRLKPTYTSDNVRKSSAIQTTTNTLRLIFRSGCKPINCGKNEEKKIISLGLDIPVKNRAGIHPERSR